MSYENLKDKICTFEVMDVRGKKMDFFPALKARAAALKNGEGLHIIQTFELLAWNQGIGFFSSEIGPSALFQAYKLIKNSEKQGKSRDEICNMLREKFGEKNPDMLVLILKAEGDERQWITGCFVFSASRRQAAPVVPEKPASAEKPLRWRNSRTN